MRIPSDNTLFESLTDFVCDSEHASYEMVMTRQRYVELVRVRKVVSAILYTRFNWSQNRIARQWGYDHSSIGSYLRTLNDIESKVAHNLGFEFMEVLRASQNEAVGDELDGSGGLQRRAY